MPLLLLQILHSLTRLPIIMHLWVILTFLYFITLHTNCWYFTNFVCLHIREVISSPRDFDMTITLSLYFFFRQNGFPESSSLHNKGQQARTLDNSFMSYKLLFSMYSCVISFNVFSSSIESMLFSEMFRTRRDP